MLNLFEFCLINLMRLLGAAALIAVFFLFCSVVEAI